MDHRISKIIDSGDVNALNRLVATTKLDKKKIIDSYKEDPISLYIAKSSIHGLGVFTKNAIKLGYLVEVVNLIELDFMSRYHHDKTILNYCYALPSDTESQHGQRLFMFTGMGMMYNHRDKPNAKWLWDLPNRSAKLVSISTISAESEITIDYGPGYWNRTR